MVDEPRHVHSQAMVQPVALLPGLVTQQFLWLKCGCGRRGGNVIVASALVAFGDTCVEQEVFKRLPIDAAFGGKSGVISVKIEYGSWGPRRSSCCQICIVIVLIHLLLFHRVSRTRDHRDLIRYM